MFNSIYLFAPCRLVVYIILNTILNLNSPLLVGVKRTCPPMLCGGNPVFGAAGIGILAFRQTERQSRVS